MSFFKSTAEQKEARRQAWEHRRRAAAQRRQVVAEHRRQAIEVRRQAEMDRIADEQAAAEAHRVAFGQELADNLENYWQFGSHVVDQKMCNSINKFYPVPAGYKHVYQMIWHGVDRQTNTLTRLPDGTLDYEFTFHDVQMTDQELARRNSQAMIDAQFWNTWMLSSAIRNSRR